MKHLAIVSAIKRRLRWPILASLVAALGALLLPSQASAAGNVLILNSYHRGKTLSDDTIDAIVTGLQQNHPGLNVLIEDMDTKRHGLETVRSTLLASYTQKYRNTELCAIVTVDNNAFDFAMENRQALFPNVPVVFCGYNGFQASILDGVEGVTGVAEAIDIGATVRVALALHPKTTHIAVVSDITLSGREVLEEFRQYSKQLPRSLNIVELAELTAPELSAGLKSLPRSTVVLRFSFFRDPDGRSFRVDEQVKLLTEAGLPVYDFWDETIGDGYVGGYFVTGASQGQMVASMLERILAGEDPGQIAVVDRSPNIPVFDKRQLLRTGADMSQLPANAVLRFNDVSFWKRNRGLLSGIGIVFLILLGFAIFFAVLSVQRKQYAVALSREEQKLRATLQSIGEGVVTTNIQGEVEQINSVAARLMGLTREKAHGRPVSEIFQLTDGSTGAVIESTSSGDFPPTASGLLITSAGKSLPIVLTAAPISLPRGNHSGIVIVFRDMTREKEMQQELQRAQRLDALGQLAGGLAHDFNNMLGGDHGGRGDTQPET